MKLRNPFKQTKRSILLLTNGNVLISLVIFAVAVSFFYSKTLMEVDNQLLVEQLQFIKEKALPIPDFIPPQNEVIRMNNKQVTEVLPFFTGSVMLQLYKGQEILMDLTAPYFSSENRPKVLNYTTDELHDFEQDGAHFRGIHLYKGELHFVLMINVDSEIRSIKTLNRVLVVGLAVLVVVSFMTSRILSERIMVPVLSAYNNQVQFIQDASHEMRTPLAVIKSALDLLIRKPTEIIANHEHQISQMLSEIRNLEQLNKNLLQLSKEDTSAELQLAQLDVRTFFQEMVLYYEELAQMQEKTFHAILPETQVMVQWDAHRISRACTILLENAFKYTEKGDNVTLSCLVEHQNIHVIVADTGYGIDEQDVPKVFERFFRSPSMRGRNIDGSGIGLSLLKAMAVRLNIKITMKSKLDVGTTVTLMIPRVIK